MIRIWNNADWVERSLLSFLAVSFAAVIWIAISMVRMEMGWSTAAKFYETHKCLKSGTYRDHGHFVGIVGKGGYYQGPRDVWVCYQWEPDDKEPSQFAW